jgi:hypothetical protein
MKTLYINEPIRAPELVRDIVAIVNRVFLWLTLVVDSLLRGLGNRDTILDLQKRLVYSQAILKTLRSHVFERRRCLSV